jgi:hypothetical protein
MTFPDCMTQKELQARADEINGSYAVSIVSVSSAV